MTIVCVEHRHRTLHIGVEDFDGLPVVVSVRVPVGNKYKEIRNDRQVFYTLADNVQEKAEQAYWDWFATQADWDYDSNR